MKKYRPIIVAVCVLLLTYYVLPYYEILPLGAGMVMLGLMCLMVGYSSHRKSKYVIPFLSVILFLPTQALFRYDHYELDILYITVISVVSTYAGWVMRILDNRAKVEKVERHKERDA